MHESTSHGAIVVRGARQNNLKNLTIKLPVNELIVVTGVSGSGKSSLVFDTLYAEGQRRYVETFSPYARQFLDRMDKPQVDAVEGIPPAIAIDQTNPVRTSRSTVGTMTELNDHLKLLFARAAHLHCRGCGRSVARDTPDTIYADLLARARDAGNPRVIVTFPVPVPKNFSVAEVKQLLERQGYTRLHSEHKDLLEVVQDRVRLASAERARVMEALESALRIGHGRVNVYPFASSDSTSPFKGEAGRGMGSAVPTKNHPHPAPAEGGAGSVGMADGCDPAAGCSAENSAFLRAPPRSHPHTRHGAPAPRFGAPPPEGEGMQVWKYSTDLHCADCDIHYQDPTPSLFSFNSPVGACEACRGFGRVIGVDYGLVIPDEGKTLRGGAIRPWQTETYRGWNDDLIQYARKRGVPLDTPWRELTDAQRRWVFEGDEGWVSWRKSWPGKWYGIARFFKWLETKAYKMHIRVLLSRYRAYTACEACNGARLKTEALAWRLGTKENADAVLPPGERFLPTEMRFSADTLGHLPGLILHDLVLLPIERCRAFFDRVTLPSPLDEAAELLLEEIRARFRYLVEVGLGYLTLDRQSRTLSGGEVQRINLTTALGTSLVNTLFVLDEPSIGLHPRDMGRVIGVMQRLRDAGNTLLVVEHDPQIMFAADRILDLGPGPGERGGEVVFFGTPQAMRNATGSLTGEYLAGRKRVDTSAFARTGYHPIPLPTSPLKGEEQTAPLEPRRIGARVQIFGAAEHNLKNLDVTIPLERFVCITGVSGSGKSTLVQDVLYAALLKAKGKPTEAPGKHRALKGHERIAEIVMVDQSRIGRTTRSNPASYVGAFDAIRKVYTELPLARERDYTAGTFNFNSGNGRCPTCGGNGFEHSRCNSSRTSTCAARIATASVTAPKCLKSRTRAKASPTPSILP